MKKRYLAIALVLGALAGTKCAFSDGRYQYAQVANTRYRVPSAYHSIHEGNSIYFSLSFKELDIIKTPERGWDNQILILITNFGTETAGDLWRRFYGKSPIFSGKDYELVSESRIYERMTSYDTASNGEMHLPDQDMIDMAEGFIRCGKPKKLFPTPSCTHIFIINGQRWKITFGTQYLGSFRSTRSRVEAFVSQFEEKRP